VGASAYTFTATLQIGSTGQGVTQLQQILIADGYLLISAPTGYYGSLTVAAVEAFQKAHGLDQVGIVGPKTRAILNQTTTLAAPTTAPATPSTMTPTQRQSLLRQFQQQLQTLLAQLAVLQGQATSTATSTPQ
jgi:peptidoglycan hydrolase-like protein with peptidoglycan-binding domain